MYKHKTPLTFIGAGPGAPDLITVRGMKALQAAQVVLHDALIDPALLEYCAKDALLIDVGKRCANGRSLEQAQINQLLIEYGLKFDRVVRLKGGDPSIFGRLDEEISAAKALGLRVEVIPGVTAALAAAAAAQTPLTRRGLTRSVRLITASVGHLQSENAWDSHLDPSETMSFYMAGRQVQQIAQRLLDKGFTPNTPALILRGVSWENQDELRTTLGTLPTLNIPMTDMPCVLLVGLALAWS